MRWAPDGQPEIFRGGAKIALIGRGEIFGEMSSVDDGPRSAEARSVDDVELVEVPRDRFDFMVTQTLGFALTVKRTMAHRLRVETDQCPDGSDRFCIAEA